MKRYIAKTNVSINIVLASGANRHITFSSLTGGGSVFYTDDPEIEKAMESHYKFGKLFRIDQLYKPEKPRNKPAKEPVAPATVSAEANTSVVEKATDDIQDTSASATEVEAPADVDASEDEADTEESEIEDATPEYKTIIVTDPDDAKAYLADNFGISRTKLKKIETIKKVAAENGIVFQGI